MKETPVIQARQLSFLKTQPSFRVQGELRSKKGPLGWAGIHYLITIPYKITQSIDTHLRGSDNFF
ncbi:MAG: hypothetical protein ACJAS1_004457 [Oleiphilaceae bacterium]|jgi:hypothetical protein